MVEYRSRQAVVFYQDQGVVECVGGRDARPSSFKSLGEVQDD